MLLHSVSGFHAHEYNSDRRSSNPTPTPSRSPLKRPALASSFPRRSANSSNSIPTLQHPGRPSSEYVPGSTEATVRFQEPETDTMSEDGRSVANSEGSGTTVGGSRRKRRSTRVSRQEFHLAHPAPTLTQKQRLLQIRPKILLQLQRSQGTRPKPALDVVPATFVVPRLTKRFPRMLRGTSQLGANDFMVVKSEEYDTEDNATSETESDEESLARRDLVAVICQMRKDEGGLQGKAEIVLSDGSTWMATPLPHGLHEFVTIDERGNKVTARWVRRSVPRGNKEVQAATSDIRFTFSIIDPNSRRHPIMAFMTQSKLDIPDSYTSVSSSAGRFPPTSPMRTPSGGSEQLFGGEEPPPERTTYLIDDMMRTLIQVTGIWVALRQNWSPYFRYTDFTACNTGSTSSRGRVRSLSLSPDPNRPGQVTGTRSSTPESNHGNLGNKGERFRRACTTVSPGVSPQFDCGTIPKRSTSAGTAFMQRIAARRFGNSPSVVTSNSEGESVWNSKKSIDGHGIYISTSDIPSPTSEAPSLNLGGSNSSSPDTPTRPHRRVQSAYIPPNSLRKEIINGEQNRHSMEVPNGKHVTEHRHGEKFKLGRWKTLINFFRRNTQSH